MRLAADIQFLLRPEAPHWVGHNLGERMLEQGLDIPLVEEEPNTKVEEVVNSLYYNPEEDIAS